MPPVIRIARTFPDLLAPYTEEKIPNYLGKLTLGEPDPSSLDSSNNDWNINDEYRKKLYDEDNKFYGLFSQLEGAKKNLFILFQGRDSAGKSSSSTHIMDILPKAITDIHVTAPSPEEREHGYLWRFSKDDRLPKYGDGRILDRTWAERVLAERVLKYASPETVQNSYAELRAWEWLLWRQGAIFIKFWIEISHEEQERRFRIRQANAPWKLSDSDQISHSNWDEYTEAANEMFYRTGTDFAPWTIISGQNRQEKLLTVMRVINMELESRL